MTGLEEIVDLALELGGMMLECNSEIRRCESVIRYVLIASKVETINVFTLTTCIYLTATKDGESVTRVKRIYGSETNLAKISAINQLSRDISQLEFSRGEIRARIREINSIKDNGDLIKSVTISLSCMAFGYMFHTDIILSDLCLIFLITFFTYYFAKLLKLSKMNFFMMTLFTTVFMTFLVTLADFFKLAGNMDHIIVGAIMYVVPGVAITNCVRDMLNSDVLSGTVRMVECLFIGLAIAIGVFITLYIYSRGTLV